MLAFFCDSATIGNEEHWPPSPSYLRGGYKRLKSVEINKKIVVSLFTLVAHLVFSPFDS